MHSQEIVIWASLLLEVFPKIAILIDGMITSTDQESPKFWNSMVLGPKHTAASNMAWDYYGCRYVKL